MSDSTRGDRCDCRWEGLGGLGLKENWEGASGGLRHFDERFFDGGSK